MKIFLQLVILIILCPHFCSGQEKNSDQLRIMFYNVENLFDPFDDTLTLDDEFTPYGSRYWTWTKFDDKITRIFKVIAACGIQQPPAIIGLCEIENQFVLKRLTEETPLLKYEYQIVHKESPDQRGIDVALLFNPMYINIISKNFFPVTHPENGHHSRDILYAMVQLNNGDTIHIFVNHWPSKYSGAVVSEPFRNEAARVLKSACDSIIRFHTNAQIIIMGDFNDNPESIPVFEKLHARPHSQQTHGNELYNLAYPSHLKQLGTHKYQGTWNLIDQFIVTGSLLQPYGSVFIDESTFQIPDFPFLLEPDEKYTGLQPNRTFIGYKFHGGFSDHLPILLDITVK